MKSKVIVTVRAKDNDLKELISNLVFERLGEIAEYDVNIEISEPNARAKKLGLELEKK